MSEIRIDTVSECGELPIGASKMFGLPSVYDNEEFEVPTFDCRGMEHDMTFIAQIKCSDIASLDTENILPHTGMLYFFYNTAEMPSTPDIEDAAAVIYDEREAKEVLEQDEDENIIPEVKLSFHSPSESVSDDFVILPELYDELSEEDETEFEDEYESEGEDIILLKLKLFGDDDTNSDICGESLCFLIDKKCLQERDFSDIRVMVI